VGSYKSRTVAYRNDYCIACDAPRRTHEVKSFKAYHVYYIPVIPLGFWREWQCSTCGRDPHQYPGLPRRARWAVVLISGLFAMAGIVASFEPQDSAATVWVQRLGLPAVFLILLWLTLRKKPDRVLRKKLAAVVPDEGDHCALCYGPLILEDGWRCSQCGAEREVVTM
jgi:hypothetical protein